MKRLRLSFHSPKENNAMARVRNRWNKWLTRTARLAPTLCVVSAGVVLILFSSAGRSHGQTISDTQVDPAAPPPASWTVYDYNPSGQAIRPRVSANSMPATTTGDTTSFQFLPDIYTALLTTTDPSLTGDLSMKTLSVTVSVAGGAGTFQDQHDGGCIPDNKSVRFYIESPKASGTTGPGTTGFYTRFWWSNPMSVPLVSDPQGAMSISQPVNALGVWSDWNGKLNNSSPEVMEAFLVAIQNVQTVGLSFGGGCFFENGVTTSDGSGTFSSTFTETP
jgi:hypothetical protein